MKRIGAALLLTAGLVAVPAPADAAAGLCWLDICGFAWNVPSSRHAIRFQCADGNWRWLHVGEKSTQRCKDANKIHTSAIYRTYRYVDGRWQPLHKNVTLPITDGHSYRVKVLG